MKIGRNDECPCGSGKKYKRCCLGKSTRENEYEKIRCIIQNYNYDSNLADILCNLLRYMKDKQWIGACHAASAALYVALCEDGYFPDLCVGEVEIPSFVFDHSWIELDKKIIDLAICMTLMGGLPVSNPIILDTDVVTGNRYNFVYGTRNGRGLDAEAKKATTMPFCTYMDNFPDEQNGLWGVVEKILNRKIDYEKLREKYKTIKWVYK